MKRGRGRPSSAEHPVVAVALLDDIGSVAWSDGEFAGTPVLVDRARLIATTRTAVEVGPSTVVADDRTPGGALAAMIAAGRGRVVVMAPTSVILEPRRCVDVP